MDTDNGGKTAAREDAKRRKLFNSEPSSKRLHSDAKKSSEEAGDSGGANSDGGETKEKIENGKGKKRKLFSSEDGSENPSKRLVHRDDNMERSDETVAKEHGEKTIIDLPCELLTKIIDLVPKSQWASLELVSHRFQEVMHGMWGQLREIRLDEFVFQKEKKPYQLADAILRKFLLRAPNVTSISGFAVFCDRRKSIRLPTIQLLSKFEHLQTIDFSGNKVVTAGNFAVFLETSASQQCWKGLDVDGGIYANIKSQNVVGNKSQPALNLEYFKFNMENLSIFDRFLPPIEWSGLKKLVIIKSFHFAKDIWSIIRQCTQIVHLEFAVPNCHSGQPSYGEFMQAVANLENLSVLKINDRSWSGDTFLAALLVLIQDLRRRGITDLTLMCYCSDQMIGAIIDYLPHLKSLELDVTSCDTASLVHLANEMGRLETLKLLSTWGTQIDGTVIRAIVDNMGSLQCLHLVSPNVNAEDLTRLGDLRKLKELRIIIAESETVDTWTRMGFGSLLETLKLSFRRSISPKAVSGFFKNMPRLSCLVLEDGATNFTLEDIAISCPNLVELNLGWSVFTSAGIQSIIDCCSQLKILKIRDDCGMVKEWCPAALTVYGDE